MQIIFNTILIIFNSFTQFNSFIQRKHGLFKYKFWPVKHNPEIFSWTKNFSATVSSLLFLLSLFDRRLFCSFHVFFLKVQLYKRKSKLSMDFLPADFPVNVLLHTEGPNLIFQRKRL